MPAAIAEKLEVPKADALVVQAQAITINDAADYEQAIELGKAAAGLRRKIVDFFKPLKQKADEAKRALLDKEKQTLAPVEQAEGLLKTKVTAWRAAEEERRKAEIKRQEERSLKLAAKAINHGDMEKAEAILNKEITVASDVPQVSGIRRTVRWKFRIADEKLIPREYLIPNEVAIGQFVRTNKEKSVGVIAGIEVYSEEDTGF